MEEFRELFNRQLGRLEELVSRLLHHRYDSAQDLWTIQTDLARYQIELRAEIRKEGDLQKETNGKIAVIASRREGEWKKEVQGLQADLKRSEMRVHILEHALSLSKQFGDAIAWLFLKGDEQRITALAVNEPNPPIPSGPSLQAMLAVAESFANAGAGFPLIHDVTNCLRVGDLTFCNILDDDDEPLTVEVKAKTLGVEGDIAKMQVSIYAPAIQPKFVAAVEKMKKIPVEVHEQKDDEKPSAETEASKPPRRNDPRLTRQVKRMAHVRSLQTAGHLEVMEFKESKALPLLPVKIKMRHSYFHWDVVREMASEAKIKGYAARPIDDAFFYAVTYTDEPSVYPWSAEANLPFEDEVTEAAKKDLPLCADASKNHICFRTTWDYLSGEVPPYIRPFLLYEIPADMRIDILWRRLMITVYINIGKIVEALERAGIEARVPDDDDELNGLFIPTGFREVLDDGSVVEIRGGNLNEHANKVGFEFMSLDGFVSCVSQLMRAGVEATKIRATAERAAAGGDLH
jgi:hypothetical protein